MSTQQSTMDYLMDQLRQAGPVSCRRMFGEYCLYYNGAPVGLVCDDMLFLKPTAQGRALLGEDAVREGSPFPGARPHLRIDADAWDDAQALSLLVRSTALALPLRPAKKPASAKAAKTAASPRTGKAPPTHATPAATAASATALVALPNLGPKSAAVLARTGIHTLEQLRQRGAVPAYVAVKRLWPRASLNLLWALEGALTGLHWRDVAQQHRTSLLLALEDYEARPTA